MEQFEIDERLLLVEHIESPHRLGKLAFAVNTQALSSPEVNSPTGVNAAFEKWSRAVL